MRKTTGKHTDIEIAAETARDTIAVIIIAAIHPDPENEIPTDIVSRVMKMDTAISDRDILPIMKTTATARINAVTDAKAKMRRNRNRQRSSSRNRLA